VTQVGSQSLGRVADTNWRIVGVADLGS
jgi:hypothetical protein